MLISKSLDFGRFITGSITYLLLSKTGILPNGNGVKDKLILHDQHSNKPGLGTRLHSEKLQWATAEHERETEQK